LLSPHKGVAKNVAIYVRDSVVKGNLLIEFE
jgi:putative cofactor-binding repeat protein